MGGGERDASCTIATGASNQTVPQEGLWEMASIVMKEGTRAMLSTNTYSKLGAEKYHSIQSLTAPDMSLNGQCII